MSTPSVELMEVVVAQVKWLTERNDQCSAWLTERCDQCIYNSLPRLGTYLSSVMADLLDIDDDRTVDLVLDTCLQRCSQRCACVVAVRYKRLDMLFRSLPRLVPKLVTTFWGDALVYMSHEGRWTCIQTLLARGTGRVCWTRLGYQASFKSNPAASAVFDMLFDQCLKVECVCIETYFDLVNNMNFVDRIKMLVYSESTTIQRRVLDYLNTFVLGACVNREYLSPDQYGDLKGVVAQVKWLTERYDQCSAWLTERYDQCIGNSSPWLGTSLSDVMADLLDIDDNRTVDLVLDTCLQRCSQRCACVVAVRYKRLDMLFRSLPMLVPELVSTFWGDALEYMINEGRWTCIQTLLARGTGRVCWTRLGYQAIFPFKNHPVAITVFDMLLARCLKLECQCINNYFGFVTHLNFVDRFKMLVYSESTTIQQLVLHCLNTFVLGACINREYLSPDQYGDLNGFLTVACEAGLLARKNCTAMRTAVDRNQPDVVCFLYHAGAASNRDLFQLSRLPALEAKTKADPTKSPQWSQSNTDYPSLYNVEAAKSIQAFLSRVASTPRSLKTLCLLQVSGPLGWGHGRESKREKLQIPYTLKDELKFEDQSVLLRHASQ